MALGRVVHGLEKGGSWNSNNFSLMQSNNSLLVIEFHLMLQYNQCGTMAELRFM
jgi:hypothetical protein